MTMIDRPALTDDSAKAAPKGTMLEAAKRYLARFDDGEVLRWAFRGLLIGTCTVLGMDLYDLSQRDAAAVQAMPQILSPILPPAFETGKPLPADPRRFVTGEPDALRQPIRFTLAAGGVLMAEGAIDQGAAKRLGAELDARGEYVRTVSLNSPGGVVQEAIAMAELLRQRKLNTEVADGAICASSCPLIFAGGDKRFAGPEAAIGLHQFFASDAPGETPLSDPAQALSDAQVTTARISRHLREMGVDPTMWIHALDTPPQQLYYLSPQELKDYRLATDLAGSGSETVSGSLRAKPAT